MKGSRYLSLILLAVFAFVLADRGFGQEARPDGQGQAVQNQPQDVRGNALRQLGLSKEQIQQIRRLNMERKPLMDEAQRRFREANRALDEAIYADQVNDADVQNRLREVQLSQAEVAKVRYMNELSVRRILTQEQLIRFRELRQRFEKARENLETARPLTVRRQNGNQDPANVTPLRNLKQQIRPAGRPNQPRPQF
ncbi:MAG: Spy/CpxP family protein refolding chaperone [Pyrinomonadaceae bacterium]